MTDQAQRREQILKAADRLLRHYGPSKTTVADVAREAGVGVGSVYLEFPSKDAIVEELSRSRHRAVLDAMQAAASAPERTFRERLSGAFDARLKAYLEIADEGAHACDLVHCMSSAVKTAQQSFYEEELSLVASVLRKGTEAGELDVADAEASARGILRAYASFSPPWVASQPREETARALSAMHELVLYGVIRRGGRRR
jgi:AcrR family transcriptional regulator